MEQTAVIIPVYNGEQFLARAIDSVLWQTRRPSSIVVVDDASTDGTLALARGYASRGNGVEVLTSDVNRGPGAARNRGIGHVRAEFLFFLDADDWWLPRHCETVLAQLESQDCVGFAHSFGVAGLSPVSHSAAARVQAHDSVWHLLVDSYIPQSAVVARRGAVLAVGGYDQEGRYAEDYDLWLRMASVAPYLEIREGTYERGSHAGQASRRTSEMFRGAWAARGRLAGFASGRGMPLDQEQWRQVLRLAFQRDLELAWRSRSRRVLKAVLALHEFVPDGLDIHRQWSWRAQFIWPAWRLAAWGWDSLPAGARGRVKQAAKVLGS